MITSSRPPEAGDRVLGYKAGWSAEQRPARLGLARPGSARLESAQFGEAKSVRAATDFENLIRVLTAQVLTGSRTRPSLGDPTPLAAKDYPGLGDPDTLKLLTNRIRVRGAQMRRSWRATAESTSDSTAPQLPPGSIDTSVACGPDSPRPKDCPGLGDPNTLKLWPPSPQPFWLKVALLD